MCRLTIAVLGAVALLSTSAQAQRMGGGMMGGRGMGGGGVGVRGPAVGARGPAVGARGPAMGFRGPVVAPGRVVAPGLGVAVRTVSPSGRVIINGGFPFHHPFGFNCFGGFPCNNRFFFHNNPFFFNPFFFGANPFFFGGGFGGGFGWGWPYSYVPGFDTGYYPPPEQQPAAAAPSNESNVQLAVAMQRLSDEVESLREDQRRQAAQAPGASLSVRQPAVSTTFVFKDGHRVTTQNYAIAGQTLWVLTEHTAKKVPLSDLDLAATEQVNTANGIELHILGPPSH